MATTTHLAFPLIEEEQAQKHLTHNEALVILDDLVHLAVLDIDRATPPAGPAEGDRYLVAAGATGAWENAVGKIAAWRSSEWEFYTPRAGWSMYVVDEGERYRFDGASWIATRPTTLQNIDRLGIGTTADAANPLSAKLNAILFTARTDAEGGDGNLYYTMNKETAAGDLGYVFQTGYVTKAQVGTFGSDRFRIAVSADGTLFQNALVIDNATGIVELERQPRVKASTNYDNYVGVDTWTRIAINDAETNAQGALDTASGLFTAPADGTYLLGGHVLFKANGAVATRMAARLLRNGSATIPGTSVQARNLVDQLSSLSTQTLALLAAGDTVELQGAFTGSDGYFAAGETSFYAAKIG